MILVATFKQLQQASRRRPVYNALAELDWHLHRSQRRRRRAITFLIAFYYFMFWFAPKWIH